MSRRGLTLTEALVAGLILALVIFSIQTVFVGLMRGTRKSESHLKAVAALETLARSFKAHARANWVDEVVTVEGSFEGYLYQVEESDLIRDPHGEGVLEMRNVTVTIEFEDTDAQGKTVVRRKAVTVPASR